MTAMTACALSEPPATSGGVVPGSALRVSACGGYAARLVTTGGGWYPERWTLDGPEPYTVPLPGGQPEDPESGLLPLSDGRVMIARRAGAQFHFTLLYPSGPQTGEVPLGAVDGDRLTLLPPAPDGMRAYALVTEEPRGSASAGQPRETTGVWLVCGGAFGPELVARVPGRCTDGGWLDAAGQLLVLNRTDPAGRVRAVTLDVTGGARPAVLFQLGEESNDRLLLADPDSGLLLVASDAPGEDRIGWGVLGSHRPVRFPEALRPERVNVSALATQPGQTLFPESCGVVLRMTAPDREWPAVWRPQQRELQHLDPPAGWLPEATRWTADGELLLPYSTPASPCGQLRLEVPVPEPRPLSAGSPVLPQQAPPEPAPEQGAAGATEAAVPEEAPGPATAPAQATAVETATAVAPDGAAGSGVPAGATPDPLTPGAPRDHAPPPPETPAPATAAPPPEAPASEAPAAGPPPPETPAPEQVAEAWVTAAPVGTAAHPAGVPEEATGLPKPVPLQQAPLP